MNGLWVYSCRHFANYFPIDRSSLDSESYIPKLHPIKNINNWKFSRTRIVKHIRCCAVLRGSVNIVWYTGLFHAMISFGYGIIHFELPVIRWDRIELSWSVYYSYGIVWCAINICHWDGNGPRQFCSAWSIDKSAKKLIQILSCFPFGITLAVRQWINRIVLIRFICL